MTTVGKWKVFNDYDSSVFISLYDKLDKKDNVFFIKNDSGSWITANLLCNYENIEELTDCYNSILFYKNQVMNYGYDLKIPYAIEYDFEFKNIGDYQIITGNKSGLLNDINQNVYEEIVYNYYSTTLTYQLEDALLEMDSSDKDLVMNHSDTHRVFKKFDNGVVEYYDDVIAHEHYYGISFGGLYKILVVENFNVVGNPWHYTVTVNSDIYEFSYDFNDFLYENNNRDYYGYYYKKNGQKIKMTAYFYNCLETTEINEMFGLNIYESANKFIWQEN